MGSCIIERSKKTQYQYILLEGIVSYNVKGDAD